MNLPRFTGDSAVLHEKILREHNGQNSLTKPMSRVLEKTVRKRSSFLCQRCHTRRVRCDKKKPFCTPCERAGKEAECTYDMQIKNKPLAGPDDDADENNTSHLMTRRSTFPSNPKVNADQINKNEDKKKIMNDFEVKMLPINKLKRRIQVMKSWDTVGRQEQQKSPIREGNEGHVKIADIPRMHVMNGEDNNVINSIKLYVEYLTGEAWDWWPLRPSIRQLLDDEIRRQLPQQPTHAIVFGLQDIDDGIRV